MIVFDNPGLIDTVYYPVRPPPRAYGSCPDPDAFLVKITGEIIEEEGREVFKGKGIDPNYIGSVFNIDGEGAVVPLYNALFNSHTAIHAFGGIYDLITGQHYSSTVVTAGLGDDIDATLRENPRVRFSNQMFTHSTACMVPDDSTSEEYTCAINGVNLLLRPVSNAFELAEEVERMQQYWDALLGAEFGDSTVANSDGKLTLKGWVLFGVFNI